MKKFFLGTMLFATALLATAAPATKMLNGVLVNAEGMTLYTYDKDVAGKSNCNGPCLANWPAALASTDARPEGELSIVTRDDGSKQWAYQGKPLYTFVKDAKPGDKTGDNVKDVWHVVK